MKVFILFGFLITLSCLSFAQETKTDSVTITFEVVVPESTPDDATIFWAGSLNRWDPGDKGSGFSARELAQPLKFNNDVWQITLTAANGDTVTYKYSRGSIFSVEENADFTYRPVRTVVFNESKRIRDTVAAWHDRPPESLADKWPIVNLKQIKKPVSYNGRHWPGSGTIITDKEIGARFFDIDSINTEINGIPKSINEHVFYFLKVSDAPDNTIFILAGSSEADTLWNVYVDQNNNNAIESDELVFTADSSVERNSWSGDIHIQTIENGSAVNKTVNFTINHATDLPKGYRSSANPDAPNLTYLLPFKQRKGTLKGSNFYLTTLFESNFSRFFHLNVDRDQNDTLEVGSGSNEVSSIDHTQMYRQQKYYIHPIFQLGDNFWEVVKVDSDGSAIRLRPARDAKAKANIAKGKPSPAWEATTVEGKKITSQSLQGKYVLLDFWGSWCGPCIDEIPLLKEIYERFKSENFEMVGFAYESEASLNRALAKYELAWPQVLDEKGNYSTKFLVRGYPTKYLIGPDGTVLETGSDLRGEKLTKTLEKYLE